MPYRASVGHFDRVAVFGLHWSPMLRKSPYSLPASQYGGGRKRIFIGLIRGRCLLLLRCIRRRQQRIRRARSAAGLD